MPCGDVVPNTVYLPACGLTSVRITKSAAPPDGSLIFPGNSVTWTFVVESNAAGAPGISFEDIFDDCTYLDMGSIIVSAGWTVTPDGGNPCRLIFDNPTAVNPGIHVITMTATAGAAGPAPMEGYGTLRNTANVLTPFTAAGNAVELIFSPQLIGDAPDQGLGVVVNYQYQVISGTAPFTVSLFLGALPDGLVLSPSGLLSGITTATGDFTFTLQLLDGNANTYLLPDEIVVATLATIVNGEEEAIEPSVIDITAIAMS